MSFIRPVQTKIYNIFDLKGLCHRLGSNHLNEHRFQHNFQDYLDPLWSCNLEMEDISRYLLHCNHFSHNRVSLMNSVKSICDNFDSMSDNVKEDLVLYGDLCFDENKNKVILKATINYIKNNERFSEYLFWLMFHFWFMPNFLPIIQTTQLLKFSVLIIVSI